MFDGILPSPPRSNFLPLESTIDIGKLPSLPSPPKINYGPIPVPKDFPSPGQQVTKPPPRQRRTYTPRKKRVQPYKIPTASPRRKPVTPKHSLRSRRDSPPRFDLPDDSIIQGSPRPSLAPFDDGYDPFAGQNALFEDDDMDGDGYQFFKGNLGEDEAFWDTWVCSLPCNDCLS
jgi:hypothetical protein